MTEGEAIDQERVCVRCEAELPANRSVCPSCGMLQHGHRDEPAAPPPRQAPRPTPNRAALADVPVGGPPIGPPPTRPAPEPAYEDDREFDFGEDRRKPWKPVLVVIVVLACIGAAVAGFLVLTNDDDGSASSATTTSTAKGSGDARVAAVRSYCDDPRALKGPGTIATFEPGAGAVAYVEVPQPDSITEADGERVVQVSPKVGKPNLDLEKSLDLVSLAVCLDEASSKAVGGTCDYELTNPDSLGDETSSKLLVTTYDVKVYELRTGKVLTKDTLATPSDQCPEFAYTDLDGVSNPVTDAMLLDWIAKHLPGGKPA